ncbi:MAG: anthranilate phosphoribosyltransferase [Campylobacterota bacterium]
MEYEALKKKFDGLFRGELSDADAKSFLVQLYQKGESGDEIAAATQVMREHSIKLDVDDALRSRLVDTVGTGGDKIGSVNISSTVSLLLASMGVPVAKHGNRSITSKSGSADMLENLGINLNLEPQKQLQMLQEVGFTFLFAQNFHPAMKYIMPIRKSLDHRTIFNILGPLCNPAGVQRLAVGVFDKNYIDPIAQALLKLHTKKAFVLSSKDGMDEASISDITYGAFIDEGLIQEVVIDPQKEGLQLYDQKEILGGDAAHNAAITKGVLSGEIGGAKRDITLLNAGLSFIVAGVARDLQEGIEMAKEAIDSKKAKNHLQKIIDVSSKL